MMTRLETSHIQVGYAQGTGLGRPFRMGDGFSRYTDDETAEHRGVPNLIKSETSIDFDFRRFTKPFVWKI